MLRKAENRKEELERKRLIVVLTLFSNRSRQGIIANGRRYCGMDAGYRRRRALVAN